MNPLVVYFDIFRIHCEEDALEWHLTRLEATLEILKATGYISIISYFYIIEFFYRKDAIEL